MPPHASRLRTARRATLAAGALLAAALPARPARGQGGLALAVTLYTDSTLRVDDRTPATGAAARAGDPAVCRTAPVGGVDLTFQARLDPTGCALGAFERAPAAKLSSRTDRREAHAEPADDFTEQDGYRPPPLITRSPSPDVPPGDTLAALRGLGVDFSVPERDLREWLANSEFTPYPAITTVLLNLLRPKGLRQPVFLDVIVFNYEHAPGARSPRQVRDVNLDLLEAAIVEGYNNRHGTAVHAFAEVMR